MQEYILEPLTSEIPEIISINEMINQYNCMIDENKKCIELGDDVDNRIVMIEHLNKCIEQETIKLNQIKELYSVQTDE